MVRLSKDTHQAAMDSLLQFFDRELGEPIGNLAAAELLDFILIELGPLMYNQAVVDVQARLQSTLLDLDQEMHQDELPFWPQKNLKATPPKRKT